MSTNDGASAKKSWDDWSDLDVNIKVAECNGGYFGNCYPDLVGYENHVMAITDDCDGQSYLQEKDYCNDPADMWPIILENNIVITPCMGKKLEMPQVIASIKTLLSASSTITAKHYEPPLSCFLK